MALAETAKLVTVLTLDDKLSPGLKKTDGVVKRFGGGMKSAGKGVASFAGTMVKAGAVATGVLAGGLAVAIKSGIRDLATLETATTSVTGSIKQMGLTGQVTAQQVAGWANEIESDIGAAFDDKDITAATSTLIRFGKLTPKNIRPAMVVMTDLAAKTGDVSSASSLLAKALAAPEKAAGKLARVGVILTKEEQKQITAFVKAGKVGKAQQVVLDAIAKSTKGAAAASQGPYQRALSTLADVSEDARKALAEGFLPVIERVAGKLSKVLADPKAVQSIRDFGKGLANAFDDAVRFAEGIDWGAVSAGLKSAFGWGQKLVGVFNSLPAETKGLIIGLAGLTKLTGGAPIKIAVDFAKDAIGGIFGHFFDRGASPANPMWVAQVGGGPGGVPVPGGTPKVPGIVTPAIGAVVALDPESRATLDRNAQAFANAVHNNGVDNRSFIEKFLHPINPNKPSTFTNPFGPNPVNQGGQTKGGFGNRDAWTKPVKELQHAAVPAINRVKTATDDAARIGKQGTIATDRHRQTTAQGLATVKAQEQRSLVAFRAGERATLGVKAVTASRLAAANAKLDAIRHKKMSFRTTVNVRSSVSVRNVNNSVSTSNRYSVRSLNQAI